MHVRVNTCTVICMNVKDSFIEAVSSSVCPVLGIVLRLPDLHNRHLYSLSLDELLITFYLLMALASFLRIHKPGSQNWISFLFYKIECTQRENIAA